MQETKITVYALFITVHSTVHVIKNIKNGSHSTIHTFKNYFATIFSVFNFSNNKFNPNGSIRETENKRESFPPKPTFLILPNWEENVKRKVLQKHF